MIRLARNHVILKDKPCRAINSPSWIEAAVCATRTSEWARDYRAVASKAAEEVSKRCISSDDRMVPFGSLRIFSRSCDGRPEAFASDRVRLYKDGRNLHMRPIFELSSPFSSNAQRRIRSRLAAKNAISPILNRWRFRWRQK